MPTTQSLLAVQQVYIAYYGRPADPEGLQFWGNQLDLAGGNFNQIIAAFAASAESLALYGANQSDEDLINTIYINLLGRPAEPSGLAFWLSTLESGQFNNRTVILAILQSAQGSDAQLIANKIEVANLFTQALADGDLPYFGAAAAAVGRTLISQVSADEASVSDLAAALPAFLNVVQLASLNPAAFSELVSNGLINDLSIIRENLQLSELLPPPPVVVPPAVPPAVPPVVLPPAPPPPVVFEVTGNADVALEVQAARTALAEAQAELDLATQARNTAQTELADAQAKLEGLTADLIDLQANLADAQASLDAAQTKVNQTEFVLAKLTAATELADKANALAQNKLLDAVALREQAASNKDAADAAVLDAQQTLTGAGEAVTQAELDVTAAQLAVAEATTPGTQEAFVISLSSRNGFTGFDTAVRFTFGDVDVVATFAQNAGKATAVAAIAQAFNNTGLFTAQVTGSVGNPTVTVAWNEVGNQADPVLAFALLYNSYKVDVAVVDGTPATFPSQAQLDALTEAGAALVAAQFAEDEAAESLAQAEATATTAAKALQKASSIEKLAGFAAAVANTAAEKADELVEKAAGALEAAQEEFALAEGDVTNAQEAVDAKVTEIEALEAEIVTLQETLDAAEFAFDAAQIVFNEASSTLAAALENAENTPVVFTFSPEGNNTITNFNVAADQLDLDFTDLLADGDFDDFDVANGIATFSAEAAPASVEDALAILLAELGASTATVGFVFGTSTYVFQGNGVEGQQSSDVFIELAGVQLSSLESLVI